MNPLARQDSRPSLLSYWSDSNRGPTINLQAAAKPLMRWMYHRQALETIRKNRGSPLSKDVLETYSSYFPWDYVSRGTKIAILSELTSRTEFDVEARAVVDSPVLNHIAQMLWSPDIDARNTSCILIGNLVSHECAALAISGRNLCKRLVSLVVEEDFENNWAAREALIRIAQRSEGAQAIVEAQLLDHVSGLLESPQRVVQSWTCELLEIVSRYDSTVVAILESKGCVGLMSLLSDRSGAFLAAKDALSSIAQKLEGEPAMAAKILDRVSEIFQTPRPKVPGWTYDLLERLVCHTPTLLVILESKVCVQLVNLLANEHPRVNRSARNTLPYIAQMLDDTPAIASKVLDHVLALLKSSSPEIRRWACSQVGELARHESTLPTMLESKACVGLVSLLCDTHSDVVQSALYVLTDIAQKLEGAEAIVKAKVLDNVPESTESSCLEVREQTCILIGMLVHHKSILLTVLESKAFVRLLSLLHDEHPEVVWSATRALSQIAEKLEGAQAIEKAKVLDNVSELIESLCLSAPHRACTLIEAVVHHGSILLPVLESKAFAQLLSLLHNEDLEIVQRATKALFQIAEKLEGAQALVESKVLDDISGLLESSCWGVQYWACTLIEELACHESILPAVLESKVSVRLFPLLHDKCSEVVQSATRALSQIAEKLEGAQAIVKAQVLDNVSELIESSCSSVRFWACILIDALVHHESILPAVLESKTCAQLVAFLLWEATTSTNPYLALCVLREISEWPVGAAALIDMPVKFGGFEELCQSSDYVIQRAARSVLDDLARARSKQQIL